MQFGSVAKVCNTDQETIEKVYLEIVAQVQRLLRKGCNLRISFKVGTLEAKNGVINWRQVQQA